LKEKGDIAFLQETHCTAEIEKSWNDECGCDTYFSNGTSSSRGVMIMISKKLDIDVTEQIKDSDGRFLMLKCIIQGTNIVIHNDYAPNNKNEHLTFLTDIKTQLNSLEPDEYEYMVGVVIGILLMKILIDQEEIMSCGKIVSMRFTK
jgi:exonuclease III